MTFYDTWITEPATFPELLGLLGSEEKPTRIPSPGRRSPMFPEGYTAFFVIRDGIRSGRFQGTQINHLTWGALMTKADIVTFLTELFGAPGRCEARHNGVLQHQADRVRDIWAFVTELPEGELFAVVADEF